MHRGDVPDVRRWAGIAALAMTVFLTTELALKVVMGPRPSLDSADELVAYVERTATSTMVVVLADTLVMAALIVFVAAFRQLVVHARPELRWVADIMFGSAMAFITVTLVGDALEAGTALDVWNLEPDFSAIRAQIEGHTFMFGSTGAILLALMSAASAYLTIHTAVLPRWTAMLAAFTAVSNLLWVPSAFGGTAPDSFFAAGGTGNAVFAIGPWLLWVVCVGVAAVPGRRHGTHRSGAPTA